MPEADAVLTFRFEVKTAGADTFQLPIYDGGTYNFHVVWGDGNESDITAWNDAAANHSYAGAGTWNVEITGTLIGWRFNNTGDKTLIYDISEWGVLRLGNLNGYFYGCSNLTVSATDILNLTGTTDLSYAFNACSSLTTVPSMNSWDVSSVTSMSYMFRNATAFNQNIGAWDTGSVTHMLSMFRYATAFNQNIGAWDTGAVTSMSYMFKGATAFNQNIGAWDTGLVTNMYQMFYGATAFEQDLGSWVITRLASGDTTGAAEMFNGVTLDTANYNALLTGWEAQVEPANIWLDGGNSQYSVGDPTTARAALVANGWTITDAGQE